MMPQGLSAAGPPPEKTKATKKTTKTTKKTTKTTKKKTKPKKDLTQASKLRNGGAAAYWGYKAFQALRVCSGDVTVVAEIATELLAEGVCAGAVANPGMVIEAVEAVVDSYGGMKAFRTNVTNFAQFSGALSKQLNSDGKPPCYGTTPAPSAQSGKTAVSNAGSAPPVPCSPERETPLVAGAASAGNAGTVSPFPYDSVVRVMGVGDPEVDGKLLTVIGFEPSGDGASTRDGVVVLQRRGKVVYVPASQVYKVIG